MTRQAHFSLQNLLVPAFCSSSQPSPASDAHCRHVWPAALEPDSRPSCDVAPIPLFLASESLTRSAARCTRSPGPASPCPLTPCSAGAGHRHGVVLIGPVTNPDLLTFHSTLWNLVPFWPVPAARWVRRKPDCAFASCRWAAVRGSWPLLGNSSSAAPLPSHVWSWRHNPPEHFNICI